MSQEQKQDVASVLATAQNITNKFKVDLISQLGRVVAITSNNEASVRMPSIKEKVVIKVDFKAERIQDQVTFTLPDGSRIPYRDIPVSAVEKLIDKFARA